MTQKTQPATHTPSPWTVAPPIDGVPVPRIVGPCTVAYLSDIHPASQAANARLIAAAPDLLAALRETAEALEGAALGFPPDSGQRFIYKQQTDKARAAIAKATERGA